MTARCIQVKLPTVNCYDLFEQSLPKYNDQITHATITNDFETLDYASEKMNKKNIKYEKLQYKKMIFRFLICFSK